MFKKLIFFSIFSCLVFTVKNSITMDPQQLAAAAVFQAMSSTVPTTLPLMSNFSTVVPQMPPLAVPYYLPAPMPQPWLPFPAHLPPPQQMTYGNVVHQYNFFQQPQPLLPVVYGTHTASTSSAGLSDATSLKVPSAVPHYKNAGTPLLAETAKNSAAPSSSVAEPLRLGTLPRSGLKAASTLSVAEGEDRSSSSSSSSSTNKKSRLQKDSEGYYLCSYGCDKRYKYNSGLYRHLRESHTSKTAAAAASSSSRASSSRKKRKGVESESESDSSDDDSASPIGHTAAKTSTESLAASALVQLHKHAGKDRAHSTDDTSDDDTANSYKVKCSMCFKVLKNIETFKEHNRNKHKKNAQPFPFHAQKFQCQFNGCNEIFEIMTQCRDHQKDHILTKRHCTTCGKDCDSETGVAVHRKIEQFCANPERTIPTQYVCKAQGCGMKYESRRGLEWHRKEKHSKSSDQH